jgi:hypothetical protein
METMVSCATALGAEQDEEPSRAFGMRRADNSRQRMVDRRLQLLQANMWVQGAKVLHLHWLLLR